MSNPEIHITYWKAWGGAAKFAAAEKAIMSRYPGAKFTSTAESGFTSNFIVIVNGTEVWNNKGNTGKFSPSRTGDLMTLVEGVAC